MNTGVFELLRVGPIELPNRLALAPVKTAFGGGDGMVTDRHIAYYRCRAQGGAGLIILEPLFVDPMGREHPRQVGANTDENILGLRSIVETVHVEGSLIFAHLNHCRWRLTLRPASSGSKKVKLTFARRRPERSGLWDASTRSWSRWAAGPTTRSLEPFARLGSKSRWWVTHGRPARSGTRPRGGALRSRRLSTRTEAGGDTCRMNGGTPWRFGSW